VASVTRRPVIGVTGSRYHGRAMWWFAAMGLRLFGATPLRIMPPMEADEVNGLDGLLIGGGDDIGAEIYGGVPVPDVRLDPLRDRLELKALEIALPKELPVLGICRGAQMLNVALGGNLNRDIHEIYVQAPRLRTVLPRKRVNLEQGSILRDITGLECVTVNSLHHQSVGRLGDGLKASGLDQYGIIQAIEDPRKNFRVGVQWHPEFLIYRKAHRRLFSAFVGACRQEA
jgi:putative glutamine amidotransferase